MNRFLTLAGSLAFLAPIAVAKDHLFVIGGGPTPSSSQLSIEQNVVYLRQTLGRLGRTDIEPQVLFASGPSASPDVCFDLTDSFPKPYEWLPALFGETKGANLDFRCHDIGDVTGSADRESILESLNHYAKTLTAADRLFIYVTGHGGKGDPLSNGLLHTWDDGEIHVRDLAAALDRFDVDVPVVLVMVQCYSGTFANILYEGGDPSRDWAKHRRAGFFATVDSRPAAGCTPDTKVADYREYTTSFLAALSGYSRMGQPVETRDVNEDGVISLAEAHSMTVVDAPTIDIGYRTSDLFLERQTIPVVEGAEDLLREDITLDVLLERAEFDRRFALSELARELEIDADRPIADAEEKSERDHNSRQQMRSMISALKRSAGKYESRLKDALLKQWPSLRNSWNPQTHQLLVHRPEELTHFLEEQRSFAPWQRLTERAQTMRQNDLAKEKTWAKYQRFLLTARSVIRAHALRQQGTPEAIDRYQRLIALEHSSFTPVPTAAVQTSAN